MRVTRFGYPYPRVSPQESRVSIFQPTLGFDGGRAPQEAQPGYTPDSHNFVYSGGHITPRAGLDPENFSLNAQTLFGMECFDTEGMRFGVTASSDSLGILYPNGSWSTLSYVAATGGAAPAADIISGWDGSYLYDAARDLNIAVLTNALQLPMFLEIGESTTTFSDYTWATSLFSTSRSLTAFDNRLVWFNVSSTASEFPQRVLWSSRGLPTDYSNLGTDAGFEDLMDMRGPGQRIVAERDAIALFTTDEIWRGRRRGDAYVFDFYAVDRSIGCPYPRTIAKTPFGLVFLGSDLEVYLLRGDDLIPLGPTRRRSPEEGDASRVQGYFRMHLENRSLAFGVYESRTKTYQLYYCGASENLFPAHALFYCFDNDSWFIQHFQDRELGAAFEAGDTANANTWDSIPQVWDEYNITWNSGGGLNVPDRSIILIDSDGIHYRLNSDATNDSGSTIDARWRSHALGSFAPFNYDTLTGVHIGLEVPSASNMSVYVTGDLGVSFDSGFAFALSASSETRAFVPLYFTAQSPQFEVRIADGSRPRISRFETALRDSGQWGG